MLRFITESIGLGSRDNEPNRWSTTLEKKLQQLLVLLRSMRGKNEVKLAIQNLNEVLPWLQIDGFDMKNTDSSFNVARSLLLDLWQHLLSTFDAVPLYDFPSFAKAVLAIARRSEFDVAHLALDSTNRPQCSNADLQQAHRYRGLLYTTQCYVAAKLVDKDTPLLISFFCARFLALSYFRIPGVRQQLLTAIALDSRDSNTVQKCQELGFNLGILDEREPTPQEVARFPSLFQWNRFHTALLGWRLDTEDERLRPLKEWPAAMVVRESMFQAFFKEWLDIASARMTEGGLSWNALPAYGTLMKHFLGQLMRSSMGHTRTLLDASRAAMLTRPVLITLYMKLTFSRTSVYDFTAVTEALGSVECWFKELQENKVALPQAFDADYFAQALDVVVEAAHHQVLSRFLGILYAYSDIFTGELRRHFFGDHLLKRHFFSLFLYWDYNVRNIFHQLIIYKIVRVKRSRLMAEGFVIGELGSDQAKHSRPVSHNDAVLSPIALDDTDYNVDFLLFAKIESYVKMVADQLHANHAYYPHDLEVYVPQALSEYKTYLAKYYQWESEGGEQPLKPVPLKVFASKWDIALLNENQKKGGVPD